MAAKKLIYTVFVKEKCLHAVKSTPKKSVSVLLSNPKQNKLVFYLKSKYKDRCIVVVFYLNAIFKSYFQISSYFRFIFSVIIVSAEKSTKQPTGENMALQICTE